MKILIAAIFMIANVILSGCAIIGTQSVDVGGHVSYEYQKSL
jgi:uncharacterized protein YceK